jgi:hypothetical protein
MQNCYKLEKIELKNKYLFNSIDATYIIHLENNGRYDSIQKQLSRITPSNNVYILFNKGYRCKKQSFINNSALDIIDANYYIFRHSDEQQYKNILILEDDFIFENIDKQDIYNIDTFMNKNKDKDILYQIGTLPIILLPTLNLNHWIGYFTGGMHSTIYTKKYRERILKTPQQTFSDWDKKDFFKLNKYVYKKPLCFQTFPYTENRKKWLNSKIIQKLSSIFIYILNLENDIHPGYDIMYILSKIIIIFLSLIIIIIIQYFRNQK